MKLVFLNIWGGRMFEPLMDFIKKESVNTDIFCLQEVFDSRISTVFEGSRTDMFRKLKAALSDFEVYYEPVSGRKITDLLKKTTIPVRYGVAIFVRKSITVKSSGSVLIWNDSNDKEEGDKDFNYIRFENKEQFFTVCNVHGKAFPGHKLDTDIRLAQSKKIIDFAKQEKGKVIIGGDFNLLPQAKSITMFEEAGFKNLISEFKITSTRSELNYSKFKPEERQYFADYVFVSPGVTVKNFRAPNVEISDHLPLILEVL